MIRSCECYCDQLIRQQYPCQSLCSTTLPWARCSSNNKGLANVSTQEQCHRTAIRSRTMSLSNQPSENIASAVLFLQRQYDLSLCLPWKVPLPRCSSNNNAVANVFIQREHDCNGIHHVTMSLHQRSSNKPMPMTRYSPNSRGLAAVFIQHQCARQGVRPGTLTDVLTNVYKVLDHAYLLQPCQLPLPHIASTRTHQHAGGNNSTAPSPSRPTNATRAQ